MEKHEFAYFHQIKFTGKQILISAAILGVTAPFIAQALGINSFLFLFLVYLISSVISVVLGFFIGKAQGIGILHDDHVEIKLKDIDYQIGYDQIIKINEKPYASGIGLNRHWNILVNGDLNILLIEDVKFRKTKACSLENFMTALYKRLKPEQYR